MSHKLLNVEGSGESNSTLPSVPLGLTLDFDATVSTTTGAKSTAQSATRIISDEEMGRKFQDLITGTLPVHFSLKRAPSNGRPMPRRKTRTVLPSHREVTHKRNRDEPRNVLVRKSRVKPMSRKN